MVLPIITHVIAKRGQHYHYVYAYPELCNNLTVVLPRAHTLV